MEVVNHIMLIVIKEKGEYTSFENDEQNYYERYQACINDRESYRREIDKLFGMISEIVTERVKYLVERRNVNITSFEIIPKSFTSFERPTACNCEAFEFLYHLGSSKMPFYKIYNQIVPAMEKRLRKAKVLMNEETCVFDSSNEIVAENVENILPTSEVEAVSSATIKYHLTLRTLDFASACDCATVCERFWK